MHPEIAKTLVAQHRDELEQHPASSRLASRRRFPRWHISWTRTVLAPACGARSGRAATALARLAARFVAGDHHLGPPFGLMPPRAGNAAVLSFANPGTVATSGAAAPAAGGQPA